MTPEQALSLGIFAINTMLAPDASSEEDVARLDAHGHEAVEILVQLRDSARGLERALPDLHPEHTECFDGCGLAITHDGACLDKPGGRIVCHHEADQTWTFVGHWENDRIEVEYVLPGEVQDVREDAGHWEQGLFASSASGATQEEALAKVREEYEAQEDEPAPFPTNEQGNPHVNAPWEAP